MGILGGEGFSLPVVTESEVVDVDLQFSDSARKALKESMNGDEDSHVLVISAQSGGCSGFLYDMKIMEDPGGDEFQRLVIGGIEVLVHNKDSSLLSGTSGFDSSGSAPAGAAPAPPSAITDLTVFSRSSSKSRMGLVM